MDKAKYIIMNFIIMVYGLIFSRLNKNTMQCEFYIYLYILQNCYIKMIFIIPKYNYVKALAFLHIFFY